jgi:ABC-type Fe3+/spermidine/putrescine transport system ATPase subunit
VAEFLGESNFVTATLVSLGEHEATARLPDGTLVSGSPVGLSGGPGRPVAILVRPEKLDVLDPVPSAMPGNRIAGVVDMVNFLGGQQEVEVRTCGGMLAARSYLRSNLAPPPIGTPVTLGFASGDCLIFPGAAGRAP